VIALDLTQQLPHARARGAPAQVSEAAGLAGRTVQQGVQLTAPVAGQLVGEQPLDLAMGVGARGGDHARERVDRRAQHPAGAQMLCHEDHQRRRGVVFDGALHEPDHELRAVGVVGAPPAHVSEHELQVVAARLRACPVGEQLVGGGVDLAGDESERLVGDRGNVVGHEPQEPQRPQRHGQAEPILRPALIEDQRSVTIRQREAGTEVLDGDALREALEPPALRLVRIPHPSASRRGQ
jgi:hypothetical protein